MYCHSKIRFNPYSRIATIAGVVLVAICIVLVFQICIAYKDDVLFEHSLLSRLTSENEIQYRKLQTLQQDLNNINNEILAITELNIDSEYLILLGMKRSSIQEEISSIESAIQIHPFFIHIGPTLALLKLVTIGLLLFAFAPRKLFEESLQSDRKLRGLLPTLDNKPAKHHVNLANYFMLLVIVALMILIPWTLQNLEEFIAIIENGNEASIEQGLYAFWNKSFILRWYDIFIYLIYATLVAGVWYQWLLHLKEHQIHIAKLKHLYETEKLSGLDIGCSASIVCYLAKSFQEWQIRSIILIVGYLAVILNMPPQGYDAMAIIGFMFWIAQILILVITWIIFSLPLVAVWSCWLEMRISGIREVAYKNSSLAKKEDVEVLALTYKEMQPATASSVFSTSIAVTASFLLPIVMLFLK
ncbi:hypothetical protein JW859_11745 [bacterium]|nr:hypothetical protein [bacterium]